MINRNFQQFEEFIRRARRKYFSQKDIDESQDGKELMRLCDEHAHALTAGMIGEANIVAVHPYFDQLCYNEFSCEIDRLCSLIRRVDREIFKKVLIDSYLHYPSMSSYLVEQGLMDKVIFTQPWNGLPVRDCDMNEFAGSKENYVGGCYGEFCVTKAIEIIKKKSPAASITTPISDAVLFYSVLHEDRPSEAAIKLLSYPEGSVTSAELFQTRGKYGKALRA